MTGGGATAPTKVVQITNIAPQATRDQMQSLFGHIGKIDEIRLYPTVRDVSCPVQSRICYVKYFETNCVPVAQHLSNNVLFIDRALIVIPVQTIPDEYRALEMSKNGTIVPGLHQPDSKLPLEVVNRLEGAPPQQVIKTSDPKLEENGLPEYPALPAHLDARKIEEIRRTIIVCDVKSEWRLDDLMDHFAKAGEVKCARWSEKDGKKYAMIEFCEQKSIVAALKLHGNDFKGTPLSVYHSTDAIEKPEAKSNEAAQREIEEAMSIVKEAQSLISAAIDPVIGMLAKDKRRRTRSRSRSRSKRSRSRSRRHSRSRSRTKHSRSTRRSKSRRPSNSRNSRIGRSRSRGKQSRSKDRKSNRNRREEKVRRSRSRSRGRSRSRSRRCSTSSRNHSTRKDAKLRDSRRRSRSTESKRTKQIEEPIARDYDAEERIGESGDDGNKSKSPSLEQSDNNMDISNSP